MLKITGLDALTKEIDSLQKLVSSLDGELGEIKFDPADPSSIEAAIKRMEFLIDERVGGLVSNSSTASIVDEIKTAFRSDIIERAAAARLKDASE